MKQKINVAIFSPQKEAFSETFIKAHRELIDANIFYYHGNFIPYLLDDKKLSTGVFKVFYKLYGLVLLQKQNYDIEFALIRSLKKHKINVILIEYGISAAESLDILIKANIPFVVHFHGYDAFRYDVLAKYTEKYREVFKKACKIVSVSSLMSEQLRTLGCPEQKLLYNPYGPNNNFLEVSPNYDSHQVISVGRFTEKKAPQLTILCFYLISEKFSKSKLVMVGDGPLLSNCQELVHALGISEKVEFKGIKSADEVKELMMQSSIYLQHSVRPLSGDCEGTPVSILEAMAAGLPVISTRHSGIADVVQPGITGFIVNEGDVIEMAECLETAINDLSLRIRLGEQGRRLIKERFLMKYHIEKFDDLFKRVAEHDNSE